MTRILHVRNSDIFGSPERLIISQCRGIKDFEWTVATFVRNEGMSRFSEETAKAGIDTFAIPEKRAADTAILSRLRRIVRDRQVGMIVSHDYKANLTSWLATRGLGLPLVAHYHGVTAEDVKVRLYNAIDSVMLRKMIRVIAVSEHTKRHLLNRGIKESRIVVIPNGIDSNQATDHLHTHTPIGNRPIRMIAAGRFSSEKGFDILFDALNLIKDSLPPWQLAVYGKGPEESRLRQQVDMYQLSNNIEFCGFVDDIAPVLRTMDMLVVTSRSEGMPLIILEAWREHLGVVATPVGGIPEMITSGHNGLLSATTTVADVAETLKAAINDAERIHRYGKEGYTTLRTKYSLEQQSQSLTMLYTDVLSGRGK